MSTQLSKVDGVTITQYAERFSIGYQVTWVTEDPFNINWVSFEYLSEAEEFSALLRKSIKKG